MRKIRQLGIVLGLLGIAGVIINAVLAPYIVYDEIMGVTSLAFCALGPICIVSGAAAERKKNDRSQHASAP